MSGHNDEVPVLSDVVESGNESIIQSSRLGREVLRELEALQQSASRERLSDYSGDDRNHDEDEVDDLELLIDDLVDRHITELRKDIRRLLERAKHIR